MGAEVLAQEGGGAGPLEFVQYGVLGLVIVALLLGWLWAKPAVDRLLQDRDLQRADKEKAEAQRDALLKVYEDKIMPALVESTMVTAALRPVLEEVVRALDGIDATPVKRSARGQG